MKSTKSPTPTPPKQPEYPCLKVGNTSKELVVLFFRAGEGTVVHPSDNNPFVHSVGYTSKTWEMDMFVPFTGEVVLSN